jgi:tetratricopeptide (TPR) repeat protein
MTRTFIRLATIAIAVWIGQHLVVLPARCNQMMRRVEDRAAASSSLLPELVVQVARENVELLESVEAGCSRNFEFRLQLAANKRIAGRFEEAIQDLTAAMRTSDRPEVYFDRGLLNLQTGRIETAESDLEIAAEFVPEYLNRIDGALKTRIESNLAKRRAKHQ